MCLSAETCNGMQGICVLRGAFHFPAREKSHTPPGSHTSMCKAVKDLILTRVMNTTPRFSTLFFTQLLKKRKLALEMILRQLEFFELRTSYFGEITPVVA